MKRRPRVLVHDKCLTMHNSRPPCRGSRARIVRSAHVIAGREQPALLGDDAATTATPGRQLRLPEENTGWQDILRSEGHFSPSGRSHAVAASAAPAPSPSPPDENTPEDAGMPSPRHFDGARSFLFARKKSERGRAFPRRRHSPGLDDFPGDTPPTGESHGTGVKMTRCHSATAQRREVAPTSSFVPDVSAARCRGHITPARCWRRRCSSPILYKMRFLAARHSTIILIFERAFPRSLHFRFSRPMAEARSRVGASRAKAERRAAGRISCSFSSVPVIFGMRADGRRCDKRVFEHAAMGWDCRC